MGNAASSKTSPEAPLESKKSRRRQSKIKSASRSFESKNVTLVRRKWCEALNRYDIKTIQKFATADSICSFKGADGSMLLPLFLENVAMLIKSFPDNHMTWDAIEEISPGKVYVKNFKGRGTHVGAPFGFGPFPPLPARGVVVQEDPCDLTITVRGGKMVAFVIDVKDGDLVGPPGYYHKIGGKMF